MHRLKRGPVRVRVQPFEFGKQRFDFCLRSCKSAMCILVENLLIELYSYRYAFAIAVFQLHYRLFEFVRDRVFELCRVKDR